MTRIAIAGAAGRMGKNLILACEQAKHLTLTQAVVRKGSESIGTDSGLFSGSTANGVLLSDRLDADQFDVLIDFTRPEVTAGYLDFCVTHRRSLLTGTTGLDATQLGKLREASQQIAVLHAPNTSIGVNLSLDLLRQAAKVLGDDFDIEIIEAHHRNKIDAPSGTALKMGEVIAEALDRNLDDCAVYARQGQTGARQPGTIGFQTLRAGDIVGEHTVLFAAAGERIEITHKVSDRMIFARGAIRAARWIVGQEPGYYSMHDVISGNN